MTTDQLQTALWTGADRRLDAAQYKQMLLYAPDEGEAEKLKAYKGDLAKLNEADRYAMKVYFHQGYMYHLHCCYFMTMIIRL